MKPVLTQFQRTRVYPKNILAPSLIQSRLKTATPGYSVRLSGLRTNSPESDHRTEPAGREFSIGSKWPVENRETHRGEHPRRRQRTPTVPM